MAEIRNTFVKSKMNKDLDDRLLSNGEYRNAQNVNISRSEGEDVGALENVLGNNLLSDWNLSFVDNLEIIGYVSEDAKDRAFFIATNYTDTSSDTISNVAPYGSSCYILMFDNKATLSSDKYKVLVQGTFLNFSKTHPVHGIDLIEDLLFWTDNRNQPRKINVSKAIESSTYYLTEDQISVAKYYPYSAIDLYDTVTVSITNTATGIGPYTVSASDIAKLTPQMILKNNGGPNYAVNSSFDLYIEGLDSTASEFTLNAAFNGPTYGLSGDVTFIYPSSRNVTEVWLPNSSTGAITNVTSTPSESTIDIKGLTGQVPRVGMRITIKGYVDGGNSSTGQTLVTTVTGFSGTSDVGSVEVQPPIPTLPAGLYLIQFSSVNGYYRNNWPGDEDFLKDKFVRFAYRFKFDDGEYSLISPFTQPAFIPKQDGYFLDDTPENTPFAYLPQEEAAGSSTIVEFFENKVNDVDLNINMPYAVNELADKLKISEIDILYKESDGLAIQVLETIPVTDSSITGNTTSLLTYNYQSRKPFKTLPEKETTRVFDKVPIRALSQSTVGNRVVYGNFIDKHTPPQNLDYNVTVSEKYGTYDGLVTVTTTRNNSRVSYPNHTLKQNRTYQVGIVLADRYGRQSDVILSSLDNTQFTSDSVVYNGSTVYNPYRNASDENISKWFGDSLKVLFREPIPETQTYASGYPGLYKSGIYPVVVSTTSTGFDITLDTLDPNISIGDIASVDGGIHSIIAINTATRIITLTSAVNVSANQSFTIKGPENKLGWYTYKIVVKQTEQEYYNVYLPNISSADADALLRNSIGSSNSYLLLQSFYTSLVSDNINKISSDLKEVQPEQTQFRTSDDIFYPRVGYNSSVALPGAPFLYSSNYYVGTEYLVVNNIGKVKDLALQKVTTTAPIEDVSPLTSEGIYNAGSNPLVAQLSSNGKFLFGVQSTDDFVFSVLEVKPPESRLQIYWETSTCGLVSELNNLINSGTPATPIPETPVESELTS